MDGKTLRAAGSGLPRRRLLHGAALGLLGTLTSPRRGRTQPAPRPDVVFIMADDLGFADLSCYGRREFRTEAIDRLADEGVRLTQAYANSAICSATRTALITGRYQDRLAVGLQEPIGSDGLDLGLPSGVPTLPSQLRAAGYHTALVGKWHVGGGVRGPMAAGYDYFYGFHPGATDYFYRPDRIPKAGERPGAPLYEGERIIQTPGYLTDLLGAAAVRQIEQTPRATPLFLSLHFNAPHWPWEGPDDEAVSRTLKVLRHPEGGNLAVYAAMVRRMDAAVGEVLAALERSGRARNAIVIFTSDNGGERWSDSWPLTGTKGELLEGGIRVPALVRWPGRIAPRSISTQVAASMDWLPTLLAAAGVTPDPASKPDGQNLLPVLTGAETPRQRTLFWRFKANQQAAVRDGDWKYLKLGGKEHLFDVKKDPRERADRRETDADTLKRLRAAWDGWNAEMLPYPLNSISEDTKINYPDRY